MRREQGNAAHSRVASTNTKKKKTIKKKKKKRLQRTCKERALSLLFFAPPFLLVGIAVFKLLDFYRVNSHLGNFLHNEILVQIRSLFALGEIHQHIFELSIQQVSLGGGELENWV
jgi:hypothetical protein